MAKIFLAQPKGGLASEFLGVLQSNVYKENTLFQQLFNDDNEIQTTGIADGAVTEGKISNGAVTEGKISNGAVTGGKIFNGTITADKLSNNDDAAMRKFLGNLIYPIGSYYWSSNSTNPSTLFSGTWEQVKDKFILAAGDTYSAGTTGGEATHKLTIQEMPSHNHDIAFSPGNNSSGTPGVYGTQSESTATSYAGGGQPHNNMPPYIVAYCWRRTA